MKYTIISLVLCLNFPFLLIAQPGFLDSSFGTGGKVVSTLSSSLYCAIVQNNGKIVAGGASDDFVLIRFLSNGTIDSSFGKHGLVTNIFPGYFQELNKIIELPGNKLITLAYGASLSNPYKEDILFARYDSEGNADLSFGDSGRVIADFGYDEEPANMQMQPDGKFVISGTVVTNVAQQTVKVFTARFMPDGTKDETYGVNGLKTSTGFTHPVCRSLALQQDGKILVSVKNGSTPYYFNLIRFNTNGSFDSSFGNNGLLKTDLSNSDNEYLNDVIVQADGKILATGKSKSNSITGVITIIRYNSDGTLDESFGTDGTTSTKFDAKNSSEGLKLLLQDNGKIVVGGLNYNWLIDPQIGDFAILRLNGDGTIDSSFGEDGKELTNLGGYDYLFDIQIQRDGKILAIGDNEVDYPYYVLTRYLGDPTHPLYTKIKRWIRKHILNFEDTKPNADYYVIEKSTTASGAYMPLTKINASAVHTTYSYPLAANIQAAGSTDYYRIKTVNIDNSFTYSSPIASSDDAAVAASSLKIYPNPAKDKIYIESAKAVKLRLQNSSGIVLLTQTINGKGSMDISKLQGGIYYFVNTETGESLKVVKE